MRGVLISGASSGIGQALALEYAKPDINLFLCGRNLEKLNEIKTRCEKLGAQVFVKNFDISDAKLTAEFIAEIEEKNQIDLVIANAGKAGGENGSAENFSDIQEIFATNINGVINLIHPVIEKMKSRRQGQVTIISSLAGFHGIPSSPAYSASKSAIRIYGEMLRANLQQFGIKVSVICPGYVESAITANNKFFMPFLMSAEKAAQIIRKNLERDKARIFFPLTLYFGLRFLDLLPRFIVNFFFKKIARKNV